MMDKVNGYLKKSWFTWVIGIMIAILMATFGYVLNCISNVDNKVSEISTDVNSRLQSHQIDSEKVNSNINSQLSEIKNDIKWIKEKLK
jgi:hypothetical protein